MLVTSGFCVVVWWLSFAQVESTPKGCCQYCSAHVRKPVYDDLSGDLVTLHLYLYWTPLPSPPTIIIDYNIFAFKFVMEKYKLKGLYIYNIILYYKMYLFIIYILLVCIYIYMKCTHSSCQKFGNVTIFKIFLTGLFCSPRRFILSNKYTKSSNIVKYCN